MLSEAEVDKIIADPSKAIEGDIAWRSARASDAAQAFRVLLSHVSPARIEVSGWFNPSTANLSFSLIAKGQRLYGLDMDGIHRNKNGDLFMGMHKQRWSDAVERAEAFVPNDITAAWNQPRLVWQQFCAEARITHRGVLTEPEWELKALR